MAGVKLELSEAQAAELRRVLAEVLGDLSHEIAATDNPGVRTNLVERRHLLQQVAESLGSP